MSDSRRHVYGILIVVAVAAATGRLFSAQLLLEPSIHRNEGEPVSPERPRVWPANVPKAMPTFGSNDRSRWATVRSLVDEGTFVIGRRDRQLILNTVILPLGQLDAVQATATARVGFEFRTKKADSGIVMQPGYETIDKVLHPTKLEFYSSKPPLLSVLAAGLYWLLKMLTGWTLADHPFAVVRIIVFLVNIVPFAVYLGMIARLAERYGTTDWGRYFVVAAAGFGTMLTPFQITLNNHTIASYCVLFALACLIRIWDERQATLRTAPCWQLFFGAGFFAAFAVCNEPPALAFAAGVFVILLAYYPVRTLAFFLPPALLLAVAYVGANYMAIGQWRPAYSEVEGPWYQYEGSHWRRPNPGEIRSGIDFARYKESKWHYGFHVLLGHHGWFSLTPIWFLALVGLFLRKKSSGNDPSSRLPWFLAPLVVAISIIVLGFYIVLRNEGNYGGWTVGPRWLLWLTPLWLLFVIPAADRLSRHRLGRCIGYACLAVSIVSAHYSSWNPWRHPWLYDLMLACGWPGY